MGFPRSLHAVPIAQGIFVVVTLSVSLAAMLGPIRFSWLALTIGVLTFLTPLPWLVSWLMPDVLGGIMIVGFITLGIYHAFLTAIQRFFVIVAVISSAIVATGNVLLLSLLTGCLVAGGWLTGRRPNNDQLQTFSVILIACYLFSLLPNYAYYGRITLNPHSSVFLTARLFQGGIMKKYLSDRCPTQPDIPLCPYLDETGKTDSNGFLWAHNSLSERTNARGENLGRYAEIANDAIIYTFPAFFIQGLKDTWELLRSTSLGEDESDDNFRSFGWSGSPVQTRIQKHYANDSSNYARARQQQGTLGAKDLNSFYRYITYTSYLALLFFICWWVRQNMRELALAGTLVFTALALNALVFGTLSGAFVRYQARITWIAMFFVIVGFLHLAKAGGGYRPGTRDGSI